MDLLLTCERGNSENLRGIAMIYLTCGSGDQTFLDHSMCADKYAIKDGLEKQIPGYQYLKGLLLKLDSGIRAMQFNLFPNQVFSSQQELYKVLEDIPGEIFQISHIKPNIEDEQLLGGFPDYNASPILRQGVKTYLNIYRKQDNYHNITRQRFPEIFEDKVNAILAEKDSDRKMPKQKRLTSFLTKWGFGNDALNVLKTLELSNEPRQQTLDLYTLKFQSQLNGDVDLARIYQ